MDLDLIPALLFRWAHVLGAAIMAGGLIFLRVSYVPALGAKDFTADEGRMVFQDAVRRRWAMLVGIASLLLLVSGLYNAVTYALTYKLESWYHGAIGIKLIVGLIVMVLASLLAGRSDAAKRWRTREKLWLNVAIALVVGLVMLGGAMNFERMTAPLKNPRDVPVTGNPDATLRQSVLESNAEPTVVRENEP